MRLTTATAIAFLLGDAILALPMLRSGSQCMINYCPSPFAYFPPRGPKRLPTQAIPTRTNAQRLSSGLGPNPPFRRGMIGLPRQRWAVASPSPVVSSTPKTTHCGIVHLRDSKTGSQVGYIGKTSYSKGHLFASQSLSDAVTVCFKLDKHFTVASNIPFVLEDWNLRDNFPLFALIQGRGDQNSEIGAHSANYLSLGGAEWPGTPPRSAPALITNSYSFYSGGLDRTAETSVWNVNLTTGVLSAQWTNSDRSQPVTHIFAVGDILYAGGDLDAFRIHYSQEITPLNLHFVHW